MWQPQRYLEQESWIEVPLKCRDVGKESAKVVLAKYFGAESLPTSKCLGRGAVECHLEERCWQQRPSPSSGRFCVLLALAGQMEN